MGTMNWTLPARIMSSPVRPTSASGPQPSTYTHADAAVKEAATGESSSFTDRTSLLDDLVLDKKGFLSFGFLPSSSSTAAAR